MTLVLTDLPDLLDLAGAEAWALVAELQAAVAARVRPGGRLDRAALDAEQHAAHGLAWAAAYAETLARGGEWEQAAAEARSTLLAAPFPPAWYYGVSMLDAYRRSDWNVAVEDAIAYTAANRDVGAALAVAAGAMAGRQDVVEQYLRTVLASERFKHGGILTRLAMRITDPELLGAIGDGLTLAGVPQADMHGPF